MGSISKSRLLLAILIFIATHIVIWVVSKKLILGGAVLSYHGPDTCNGITFLTVFASIVLWIHSSSVTYHLRKAGLRTKTIDNSLITVWFAMAIVFGTFHYFIVVGTGAYITFHKLPYLLLFLLTIFYAQPRTNY